ncbi:MAG: 4-(cytidine 5'-diphospho)-2-C-methyl-D-erythritol kinase [Actinomycetota bacterium]
MTEAPHTRRVAAHAKINPFLRVLGRRDDRYHDIETVVLPISLADELVIHAYSDPGQFRTLSLSLDVSGDPDLVRRVPVDESNLVMPAAATLAERGGVRGFAEIALHKRIPVAAGLGGGSADAAATLRALNDLWGVGLAEHDLRAIAADLGSDVPAMLHGAALIRGRGEDVTPVDASSFQWALVTFDFGVSTRDAYLWWDQDGTPSDPDPKELVQALTGGVAEFGRALLNDLEPPVVARHPRITDAKGRLLETGVAGAVMSGSGPTVAGLLRDDRALPAQVERELERISGRPIGYVSSFGS